MAPRFKQLLYQTYDGNQDATAFVGFPVDLFEEISPFRDALRDEIVKITRFKYMKETGVYKDVDVHLNFFDDKDSEMVNSFYSKPRPGCFAWLFRTRYYRAYKAEEEKIELLIRIEISTSHDYPCVVVHKSSFAENALAQLIKKVAHNLKLRIFRSNFSFPMDTIMMSNKTFDVGE